MEEKESREEGKRQDEETKQRRDDGYLTFIPGAVSGLTKIDGLRIDFNFGARVLAPEGKWRVRIIDLAAGYVTYDKTISGTTAVSETKYYVPWRIEVWQGEKRVLMHDMSLKGQRVYVKFCSGAIGDTLAWIAHVEEFRQRHGCEVCVSMNPVMADLLKEFYPDMEFVGPLERPGVYYASYYLGCFCPKDDRMFQPSSWKMSGLQDAAAHILGLPEGARRPNLRKDCPRTIEEPYVCIAAQASAQMKYWNNADGWIETIRWLKEQGYRVLCIDRNRAYGLDWRANRIPWGAEDFTGEHPLRERLELLAHADFFVGLSSGLAWIAWGAGIPVVLISGFTLPHTEFPTPYRVINYHVCTGCWEDERYDFDPTNFIWCPRHGGDTEREFECSRQITYAQVIRACQRLMQDHGLSPRSVSQERTEDG